MAIFDLVENIICMYVQNIHNNGWKFCGDHILINFFFECIIDMEKIFKKKRSEPASLKADKQLNAFVLSF